MPRLADRCAIDLITDDGTVERLAVEHIDPEKVRFAWELGERFLIDLDDPSSTGVVHVLCAKTPELTEDIP